MRRFVIGDIHGNNKALIQCLERSKFDFDKDQLISLGDIVDGWDEVKEVVDTLLQVKNHIAIKGNHDDWFLHWLQTNEHPAYWNHGGHATLKSYGLHYVKGYNGGYGGYRTQSVPANIPKKHIEFFKNQIPYYRDKDNNFFVHGGFNRHYTIEQHEKEGNQNIFWWDRDLFYASMSAFAGKQPIKFKEEFNKIFIGHTATTNWDLDKPIFVDRLINIDTGAGWDGRLTIMDVDTKKYWQSDLCKDLYPFKHGRTN